MIRFQCPGCRSLLQTPPESAGAIVSCGKCQQRMRVPAAAPVATLAPPPPPAVPPAAESRVSPSPPLPTSAPQKTQAPEPPALPSFGRPVQFQPLPSARRSATRAGARSRSPRRSSQKPRLVGVGVLALLVVLGAALAGGFYVLRNKPRPLPADAVVESKPDAGEKNGLFGVIDPEKTRPPKDKETPPVRQPSGLPPEQENLAQQVIRLVNDQRRRDRQPPVELDVKASAGCIAHAEYLARHQGVELDVHDEDLSLPGSSETGRGAAASSSVVYSEPVAAVRAWLMAPAHRSLLLDPALKSVGFGSARTSSAGWVAAFDWLSGRRGADKRRPTEPVLYPGPLQRNVPLSFPGNEIPDPLPNTKDKLAGFPITAIFPSSQRIPDARAWLEDEAGNDVRLWFSSPTRPANDRFTNLQQNTVCLFAREVLRPGMRYAVRIEANVGPREWSRSWTFTTQPPAENRRLIYTRTVDRINHFRRASGLAPVQLDAEKSVACLAHASYLARHLDRIKDFRVDQELPELAGFTEAGQEIARRSAIRVGGGVGPVDAADWLFSSVLNRHLALNPSMKTVGVGTAQQSPRGWLWVVHLPSSRTQGDHPDAVLFPGKDQKDVPLYFGREVTSVVPSAGPDVVAGYGVTANFFPLLRVRNVKASLADAAGKDVPCWLSTPENKLPGTGNYAQILLVPKKALAPASKYTASMSSTVNGESWSRAWSFTTVDLVQYRNATANQLLASVNEARTVAGLNPVVLDAVLSGPCQKHADYIVRNLDHPRVQGLGIHEEDLSLPGASREGSKTGKASVIALISDPADSVYGWMATLYHRIPILDPELKRVGYGQSLHPSRGWATVLDTGNGK